MAPHVKKVQGKMISQKMALTKLAASTWEATSNKARQGYTAAVRPSMTYEGWVWHSPKGTSTKGLGQVAKLTTLQGKCLPSITGA